MTLILASVLLAASAASPVGALAEWRHSVELNRSNGPVTLDYRSLVTVTRDQIGNLTPNRANDARCNWAITVDVVREFSAEGRAFAQKLPNATSRQLKSGISAGHCATERVVIDREVAAMEDAIKAHVLAVAEDDQRILLALR